MDIYLCSILLEEAYIQLEDALTYDEIDELGCTRSIVLAMSHILDAQEVLTPSLVASKQHRQRRAALPHGTEKH